MGTYDPKSRRRSPVTGEDAPAAVDAMLGDPAEGSEPGGVARPAVISPPTIVAKVEPPEIGETAEDTGQPAAPMIVDVRDAVSGEIGPRVYVEADSATDPDRRRLWLVVAAVLGALLVLWAFRRRR